MVQPSAAIEAHACSAEQLQNDLTSLAHVRRMPGLSPQATAELQYMESTIRTKLAALLPWEDQVAELRLRLDRTAYNPEVTHDVREKLVALLQALDHGHDSPWGIF